MSKSILVIDTPNSCSECQFFINGFDYQMCSQNDIEEVNWIYTYNYIKQRHQQCPLQDITELLEALENIKRGNFYFEWEGVDKNGNMEYGKHKLNDDNDFNKLYKALGGTKE